MKYIFITGGVVSSLSIGAGAGAPGTEPGGMVSSPGFALGVGAGAGPESEGGAEEGA